MDLGFVEDENLKGREKLHGPIFLATDFTIEEMCSMQGMSDVTETCAVCNFIRFFKKKVVQLQLFLILKNP